MTKRAYILLAVFILSLCRLRAAASPEEFNQYFIEAARKAKPSVVNIIIYKKDRNSRNTVYRKVADATGTIITADGLFVTNYHVVAKGDYYRIVNYNGKKYETAMLKGGSPFLADIKTDIALLKIDNSDGETFVPVSLASSGELREGEWVIAIGNPYGLKQSITSGIVSSTGRDNVGFIDIEDFIQSDVSINPGSSGGPLLNLRGEMVGINTAIRTVSGGYQGISFAIPSKIVKHVVYELNRHGRVRRGWLGFLAREKQLAGKDMSVTIEISSIIKNSPAERIGLQEGDIIKKVDGIPVSSLGRLIALIGKKPVGSTIQLTIAREGRLKGFLLPLREKQAYRRINEGVRALFISYGIEVDEHLDTQSAIVSYVSPQSAAYDIISGDRIVSINGEKVRGLDELIRIFYRSGKIIEKMEVSRDNITFEVLFPSMERR